MAHGIIGYSGNPGPVAVSKTENAQCMQTPRRVYPRILAKCSNYCSSSNRTPRLSGRFCTLSSELMERRATICFP